MTDELKKVYGIDLGSTYSCIAVVDETGKPVVIRNDENEPITPSAVFFDGDNVIVGKEAKEQAEVHPDDVVQMVKRSMGDESFLFEHNGTSYRPEEISAFVLRKVAGDVEKQTGEKVTDVVITCPAYFGVNEREATAKAGEIAGLNVLSIISEPTAAAISYGMEKEGDQVVLVYDLGGGTFDITMIEVKGGDITVICTGGDHNLGGRDWDTAIVNCLAEQYQQQTGSEEDVLDDRETLQDLYNRAESAKKTLSKRDSTTVRVSHAGESPRVDLTREDFDQLTSHLLERTVTLTNDMLEVAKEKGCAHYDRILLVGGSTRMPQVVKRTSNAFQVPSEMYDPDEAVAKGAALYARMLALGEEIKLAVADETGQEVDQIDVGAADQDALAKAQEAVAAKHGLPSAAVKKASETTITNVTSKSFGIVALNQAQEEIVVNLVQINDPLPKNVSKTFGTVAESQTSVDIRLMENLVMEEDAEPNASTEIGKAELSLPSGLPAGSPIEVNFMLNDQGRLEVTATEPGSGETVHIEVETASVMSQEEVQEAQARGLAMDVS